MRLLWSSGYLIAFAILAGSVSGQAQSYPTKNITIVVGVAAGGPADTAARILAEGLRVRLKRTVVVENKPGAGTLLAARYAAAADPDGHKLFMGTPGVVLFSIFNKNANFDFEKELRAVAPYVEFPYVLATNAKFSSWQEFNTFGKSNPGKLNVGTYGPQSQLLTRYLNKVMGIEGVDVPFGGAAPAHTELMGGSIDYIFTDPGTVGPVLDSGKGKLVAVLSNERLADYPDVPTLRENGIDIPSLKAWYTIFAPIKTADALVDLLNREIAEVTKSQDVQERLSLLKMHTTVGSPDEVLSRLRNERDFHQRIAQELGVTPQ